MFRGIGKQLVIVGLSVLCVVTVAAAAELKVGDPAPPFSLKGSDGKNYSLDQFKGKSAVVIAWFPKAFTGGCTKECKSLRENSKALHDLKVAYFTASVDSPDKNKMFAESLDLDYPILSDPDKTVAKEYGVLNPSGFANRWTFYIDKEGVLKAIDKSVNAPQAGPDIAAKLKDLGLAGD
jgi:peroxiredoxin Q/BCP